MRFSMTSLHARIITSVFAGCLIVIARPANAQDLGLVPSHVFNIWTNINKAMVVFARQQVGQQVRSQKSYSHSNSIKLRKFTGKTPGDVLVRVSQFNKKFHKLVNRTDHSGGELLLAHEVLFQSRGDVSVVTPSTVYLQSAHLLVEIVTEAANKLGDDVLVSSFFEKQKYIDKTPSDVFGLVDLAARRLDLLQKRAPKKPARK